MHFEHHRSLKQGRTSALFVFVLVFGVALAAAVDGTFLHPSGVGVAFGVAIFAILGITVPILVWWLLRLYRGSGEWNIQISESEVVWQVPQGVGETSFRIPLAEISKIICASTRSAESSDQYYLETNDGNMHYLKRSASGVNLVKFSKVLQSLGVIEEPRDDN